VAGRKVFTSGEILTAADVNSFLMDQSVMVFADSSARSSAIPSPSEGMVTYLKDTNLVEAYTGAAFEAVSQPGILQVVQGTTTTSATTTSTTYSDTNLSATITPSSATSKVLIFVSQQVGSGGSLQAGQRVGLRIVRDASVIETWDRTINFEAAPDVQRFDATFATNYLDTPATTSAVTYKTQFNSQSGSSTVNNTNPAYILLMEVAA